MWVLVGSQKTLVQWPHGWWAEPSPLRVVNAQGQVVVTLGDRVELGGGSMPSSTKLPGCSSAGNAFSAWKVNKGAN
jgi:hypothetical protein